MGMVTTRREAGVLRVFVGMPGCGLAGWSGPGGEPGKQGDQVLVQGQVRRWPGVGVAVHKRTPTRIDANLQVVQDLRQQSGGDHCRHRRKAIMRLSSAVGLAAALGLAATVLPASPAAAAAVPKCTLTIAAAPPPWSAYYQLNVSCSEGFVGSFSVHGSDEWDDDWLFTREGSETIVDGGKLNEDLGDRDEIYAKATVYLSNGRTVNVGTNKVYGWWS